jgi:microcin C transport system substrate-binding protein
VRTVDEAQFINRERSWDFDSITGLGAVALARQRAARLLGFAGRRPQRLAQLCGIKDPAIDALIERVIFAKDRAELVAATRRSTACCCGTTSWCRNSLTQDRTARWDRFGRPEKLPEYGRRLSRRSGGGTPTRRQDRIRDDISMARGHRYPS